MITIDAKRESAFVDGVEVHLTGSEWDVVQAFLERPGAVVEAAELAEECFLSQHYVKVHIHNLRRKLGKDIITTNFGHGYIFEGTLR